MRGRRASFATTDRTWWSLNTLQEQTIIDVLLSNKPDEGRDGKDKRNKTAPPSRKFDESRLGHVGAAHAPGGGGRQPDLEGFMTGNLTAH
jgi:hypothetical protein